MLVSLLYTFQTGFGNFTRLIESRLLSSQNILKLKLIYLFFKGVMALLRPLLLDNVPSIQQSAALALGRLANYSDELAEAVVSNEILPQLVYSLSEQNVSDRFER